MKTASVSKSRTGYWEVTDRDGGKEIMSTNCTRCGTEGRTGNDLVCDECRIDKQIEKEVREVVERVGDPLMSDFYKGVKSTRERIKKVVKEMVGYVVLRMKEDTVNHEWSYRKGKNF